MRNREAELTILHSHALTSGSLKAHASLVFICMHLGRDMLGAHKCSHMHTRALPACLTALIVIPMENKLMVVVFDHILLMMMMTMMMMMMMLMMLMVVVVVVW